MTFSNKIFTSEEHELPREEVADFLEDVDEEISIRYVEHIIDEMNDNSEAFHDRLAELYLHEATDESIKEGV